MTACFINESAVRKRHRKQGRHIETERSNDQQVPKKDEEKSEKPNMLEFLKERERERKRANNHGKHSEKET